MKLIFDIGDPDFLSCRHFSVRQQVFCSLELAALLLLNTNMYRINEIPSYLIVIKRQYTTGGGVDMPSGSSVWCLVFGVMNCTVVEVKQ
jgi:hypothetical protein